MTLSEFVQSSLSATPHFLLIGNPVAHSFSPLMHHTAADYFHLPLSYYAVRVETDSLVSLKGHLMHPKFRGGNITIPYKKRMLNFMDCIAPDARQIGAVNTIVKREGKLVGYNTDVAGFLAPLNPFKEKLAGGRAIIFGTGGAARAIVFALRQARMEQLVLVSRNPQSHKQAWPKGVRLISYDVWPDYAPRATLLVNATPLGMAPEEGESPVKDEEIPSLSETICYDIVYRPVNTTFLKQAEKAGARTIGGLEMLIQQGSRSFELWTGKPFPFQKVRRALTDYLNDAD